MNANRNLEVGNVIQIKNGITINVNASAKIRVNIISAKKIIFVILVHVLVKVVNIQNLLLAIQYLYVIKLYERQKLFQQIFFKEDVHLYFTQLFINSYITIDNR